MVLIFVWPPAELCSEQGVLINYNGHVAFQTDKYYVSFWPLDNKSKNSSSLNGVLAELVINYKKDLALEGGLIPNKYDISHYASNTAVNRQIETFLRHNQIDPDTVAQATEDEAQETKLTEEFVYLPKTMYSFKTELILDHSERNKWFDKPQSCVSFCFNMIEMVSVKPMYHLDALSPFGTDFRVSWFEERIVKQCWMNPPVLNYCSIFFTLCWTFLSSVCFSIYPLPKLFLVLWFYLCLNIFLSYYYFIPRYGFMTFASFISFFPFVVLYLLGCVVYYLEIENDWARPLLFVVINPLIATPPFLYFWITSNVMFDRASEIFAYLPVRIRLVRNKAQISYFIIYLILLVAPTFLMSPFAIAFRDYILSSYFDSSLTVIPK